MRHTLAANLVTVGEAADRFAVSRRTLERWVRDGRLASSVSAEDGRRRLVNPEDVWHLVQQMPKRAKIQIPEKPPAIDLSESSTPSKLVSPLEQHQFNAIDDVLQLIYSHYHRLVAHIHPSSFRELSLDDLRSGPLGHDLQHLAAVARGEVREPKDLVLAAIDSVLQALFWPAAADDFTVPRSFWDTELGRMLALAKYRSYHPTELMSIGAAAQYLGVTRPTLYRWMDDRTLNYVRDDQSGRTFVVRRDVINLRRVAEEMAAQQQLQERSLVTEEGGSRKTMGP